MDAGVATNKTGRGEMTSRQTMIRSLRMRAEDLRPLEMMDMDPQTGFPMFGRNRFMVLGIPNYVQLENDLIRSLGWRKASIIFTRLGYQWGLAQAAVVRQMYEFEDQEEWLKAGGILKRLAGLAEEEIHEIVRDDNGGVVRFSGVWRDSFEALISRSEAGLRPDPVCRILTGLASGYASAVFGQEILVREMRCQAAGDDVCAFEGRPVEDWGLDHMDVKLYFAVTYLDEELAETATKLERTQMDMSRRKAAGPSLKQESREHGAEHGIIYRSNAMARALLMAEKVAPTSSTVLIQGESGTGKELIARFIHTHSGRSEHPFLAVNCAALPANLLESELFGHRKGSFTGADSDKTGLFVEAGKGTLFLDEVGEIPLALQAKLLRALQEKEVRPVGGLKGLRVRARIIAATNRDLREMVVSGSFREDLYYRLAVFPLLVTPLRDRRQDILPLARHFLSHLRPEHPGFSPDTIRYMEGYSWTGNVRELENWVEYAVVLAGDQLITPEHLPLALQPECPDPLTGLTADLPDCRELERRYIRMVLDQTNDNRTEASKILGMSITTLWRRLKEEERAEG